MTHIAPKDPVLRPANRFQAWLWAALALAALAGQFGLQAAGCQGMLNLATSRPLLVDASGLLNISGLGYVVLGLLIAFYRPENRIGRLASLIGVGLLLLLFFANYVSCGYHNQLKLPLVNFSAWVSALLGWVVILLIFVILPLIFPDGQFLSPAWRRFAQVSLAILALALLLTTLWPGPIALYEIFGLAEVSNPVILQFNPPRWLDGLVDGLMSVLMILATLAASTSLIQRWHRSGGETRQQLKWFAYFLATIGLLGAGGMLYAVLIDREILQTWAYYIVFMAWWTGIPVVIGVAVLKYRLYDIDIIIRRTLVYTLLTIVLAFLYFGLVTILQALFSKISNQQSALSIVLSTLAIAALFTPLRRRIQEGIDRRFYRRHYDAELTLQAFAATLRDEVDLDQLQERLLAVVQETMQPESVSLWLKEHGKRHSQVD